MSEKAIQQYADAKKQCPDMLLLFRIGDFYELFDADALAAHKDIGLTITRRGEFAMAGFPHHQLETYLHKLLKCGHKVAVCEQVQDSANVPMKREVTRVVVGELWPELEK